MVPSVCFKCSDAQPWLPPTGYLRPKAGFIQLLSPSFLVPAYLAASGVHLAPQAAEGQSEALAALSSKLDDLTGVGPNRRGWGGGSAPPD